MSIRTPCGCPKPGLGRFRRFARSRRPGGPLPDHPIMRTHKVYWYPRVKHTSRPLPAKPRSWAGVPASISPQSSPRPASDIISGNSSPRTCFPALAAGRGIQGSRPNRINCDRARPFPSDPWQGDSDRVSPECTHVPRGQPRAHLRLAPPCSQKPAFCAAAAVLTSGSEQGAGREV